MADLKQPDPANIAKTLLSRHDLELVSCTTLQTLWAGYGKICAIIARATTNEAATHLSKLCSLEPCSAGSTYPLILKLILPPNQGVGEGHLRKMLSYEVEQYFYNDVVPLLGDEISVAKCLASTRGMGELAGSGLMATIMVDLRHAFPVAGGKRGALDSVQVHGALGWLAGFHRHTWALVSGLEGYILPPLEESKRRRDGGGGTGIWLYGGYTYLATRRKEYASLAEDTDSEWCDALCSQMSSASPLSVAEVVALFLTPCGRVMESYIHGDVKSENLFTTRDGDKVAFFDFQYIGLGLGVCDLTKLFTCSVPMNMLVGNEALPEKLTMCEGEKLLLQRYHTSLVQNKDPGFYPWNEFKRHWETALVDWCRFQASWGFWGNTEWLEARVRSILDDQEWRDWLLKAVK
jgi:Phosphotransferase enzyme family